MDIDKINIRPQPYSKALRDIARIVEERESDAQALEQLRHVLRVPALQAAVIGQVFDVVRQLVFERARQLPGQAPPRERKW